MNILQNIKNNIMLLQADFVGVTLNVGGIYTYFLHFLITVVIFCLFYFLGNKVRRKFFKESKNYHLFINLMLGYIITGTGIGILGAFSLLKPEIIWAYLGILSIIAFSPFKINLPSKHLAIKKIKSLAQFRKDIVVWGVMLFVLIAVLRLAVPDTGEDGYHSDLPRLYLATQTSMHESKDLLHVTPYPQLPEMIYLIPLLVNEKDTTRFIHFGFYVVIILLLFEIGKRKEYSFAKYAPLLFVTAPLAIKYSAFQYTDFFMLFAFLLAVILIDKEGKRKNILLSGIIFGAVLSTKVWMLMYIPVILLYIAILNWRLKFKKISMLFLLFILGNFITVSFWYIRAFILGGSPIYPVFADLTYPDGSGTAPMALFSHFALTWKTFVPPNLVVLSPLFFLGIFFCVFYYREVLKRIKNSQILLLFCIITFLHLLIQVYLARYLLPWYIIASLLVSAGILISLQKNKIALYFFGSAFCIIFFYSFLNTVVTLPYAFGWADRNAYLTRVLGRDNISYYDFDRLFDKHITDEDLVAMYGIGSFYYANFNYIDVGYLFGENQSSVNQFKVKKVTKLVVKGGDFDWFCKKLSLTDCDKQKVKLLATYPADMKKYNLYELK